MSPHIHKRKNTFNKTSPAHYFKKIFILITVFIGIIIFIFIVLMVLKTHAKYDVKLPVNIGVVYDDGIKIVRFDPEFNEILELSIGGKVMIDTSRGMGEYPAESMYKLSTNEGMGDLMFKNSLMRNLHLPIYSVLRCTKDTKGDGMINIGDLLSCKSDENKIEDKIFLIFARQKAGGNILQKDLNDYSLLKQMDDGSYIINDNVFDKLVFDFSPDGSAQEMFKVKINSKEGVVPKYFTDIIASVGGRVVVQEENDGSGINTCLVKGPLKRVVKYLAEIFECKKEFVKNTQLIELTFSDKHLAEF